MDVILVSGSSKGLGLQICKNLLHENYKIIGISRTNSDEFKNLQKLHPNKLYYKQYDFSDICNIQKLIRSISKEHGNIYALINNAALGYDGVLGTMHESQIDELLKVNIQAPILLTKYASRSMLLNQKGRIINISSIIASTGFNGLSVYAASKSALLGFTKSLSRELGKANITVNMVAPGYMQTNMTEGIHEHRLNTIKRRSPLGKLVSVEDVANSVMFLLSTSANNITGTTITVDAGSTA